MSEDIDDKQLHEKLDKLMAEVQRIKQHIEISAVQKLVEQMEIVPPTTRYPQKTFELTTSIAFSDDRSIEIESSIPFRQIQIRQMRPGAFEAELSFQKSEQPVSESEQSHPPVPHKTG